MAKAKWLIEGSNLDLVNVIEKGIAEGASDKDAAKVSKAVADVTAFEPTVTFAVAPEPPARSPSTFLI